MDPAVHLRATTLAKEAQASGFTPLEKASSMPSPRSVQYRLERTRSASDSFYGMRSYKLGHFAELKLESLPEDEPVSARFEIVSTGPQKSRRRQLALTIQAKRSRATLFVDAWLALAFASFILAALCTGAQALAPATATPGTSLFRHASLAKVPRPADAAPATPPPPPPAQFARLAAEAKFWQATRYLGSRAASRLEDALAFAGEAHEGQFRKSGEPYVVHPIETACILAEMKVSADAVVAGLLHDVVEDTEVSTEAICARFGAAVGSIVAGVTDVDTSPASPGGSAAFDSKDAKDAFNKQRLFLAMGEDLNVVLVKLADRVHNMRTLGAMPAAKRAKKAKETLELFVPLAKAVGVAPFEKELRRLSAEHLSPLAELKAASSAHSSKKPSSFFDDGGFGARLMGYAEESFASAQCPALLDEFLANDAALRGAELGPKLRAHRESWAAHCTAQRAPHLSEAAAPLKPREESGQKGWLGGIAARMQAQPVHGQGQALAALPALYATALLAGFSDVPAAFGADLMPALESLEQLFQTNGQ